VTRRDTLQTLIAAGALSAQTQRFVGITVLPEYIQSEGIDNLLRNLIERAGVTAVTTSPYVMAPADEKTGVREPPIDAGAGKVRLLDRPLWGKRELFVTTAPSFTPDERLYKGLLYRPSAPTNLTRSAGPIVGEFIRKARAAGLKVYLQVQAAIPPGYRVQFGGPVEPSKPRMPDGTVPKRRLANNGSLACPHIRAYTYALIRDMCRAYPEINGVRVDWPEYPPYLLQDNFLDFSDPARQAAARLGFPFERMRSAAAELYQFLHGGLKDSHLDAWSAGDGGRYALLDALARTPGLLDNLRFKAALVDELLAGCRTALTQALGQQAELVPNAFPPPFSTMSGMDYRLAAKHSAGISVKLYTMHWPTIARFYADDLKEWNPGLSDVKLARTIVRLLDLADESRVNGVADLRYPEPDEPHPVGAEHQARKIRQAQAVAGETPVYALAHGYGPVEDFRTRLRIAYTASNSRVWINRYAYLSDEKLSAIKQVT
jgi:hypothetical protein